jgi:hypothetical protein
MIKLELTADEIDLILTALGDQPFVKVNDIINKIRVQAVPQWQAIQEGKENKEKDEK